MTEEIKKMIESVERYGTRQITRYSLERAKAGLTEKRFVRESDFDRIVEELTKWNKVEQEPKIYVDKTFIVKFRNGKCGIALYNGYGFLDISDECYYHNIVEWKYLI